MLKRFVNNLTKQRMAEKEAELYRKLLRHEAQVGGELFGPIPKGGRREFFCLDRHTWVWHEEWIDENGQHQAKTTRYDIRPNGILKVQDGHYTALSYEELCRLDDAIQLYVRRVNEEIYAFAV
jgi:hypothetical protein